VRNLTEESESDRVINCNELKHNKNQNHAENLFIPKFSKKDFVIFHQNIRGLNSNRLDELSVSLSANPPHIICLTEHHLDINEIDTIRLYWQITVLELNFVGIHLKMEEYVFLRMNLFSLLILLFPNGRYIDCLSLTYATNKGKMLKLYYNTKKKTQSK